MKIWLGTARQYILCCSLFGWRWMGFSQRLKCFNAAFVMTCLLYGWSISRVVRAVPERLILTQSATEEANAATLKTILENRITALKTEDYASLFELLSSENQKKLFASFGFFASFDSLDEGFKEDLTGRLKQIEQDTGVAYGDVLNGTVEVKALYLEALVDSLVPHFPQLDLSQRYGGIEEIEQEVEILSQTENTVIAIAMTRGFDLNTQKNLEATNITKFVKQNGRWLIATNREVELARAKNMQHYSSPGLLPLPETVSYWATLEPKISDADWYQTLPETTAKEKEIEVGDLVFGYVEWLESATLPLQSQEQSIRELKNLRVVAVKNGSKGDTATVVDTRENVYANIPLAVLEKPDKYFGSKPLQVGDLVLWNTVGNYRYGKISRIENGQFYAKYFSWHDIKEELVTGTVIPVPREGYLWRRVIYRGGDGLETGFVFAETDSDIWLDSLQYDKGVMKLAKKDVELIQQADTDLGKQTIWILNYKKEPQAVRTIEVIEPGLLYEIDEPEPFKDEYDRVSFEDILLALPTL